MISARQELNERDRRPVERIGSVRESGREIKGNFLPAFTKVQVHGRASTSWRGEGSLGGLGPWDVGGQEKKHPDGICQEGCALVPVRMN